MGSQMGRVPSECSQANFDKGIFYAYLPLIRFQGDSMIPTVVLHHDHVELIDQTRLPMRLVKKKVRTVPEMVKSIRALEVRGAPAIGVAAAFMLSVFTYKHRFDSKEILRKKFHQAVADLNASRPTAVNLFWATARMARVFELNLELDPVSFYKLIHAEAKAIFDEDLEMSRKIGEHGAKLIKKNDVFLTHCNAGGLATAGLGTALACFYEAQRQGKEITVYADETRPLLQGARLTAWELMHAGIDVRVIADNMAAFTIKNKGVKGIITGADRIAANGDAANKIGTLNLAILAKHYGIPFYIAAPSSTFDLKISDGSQIPIEERSSLELTEFNGRMTAPLGVGTYNPAFDVTPNSLISGFITEKGVIRKPYPSNLKKALLPKMRF